MQVRTLLLAVSCFSAMGCGASDDKRGDHAMGEGDPELGEVSDAVSCYPSLGFYPVAGPHNGGYDANALNYTCPAHPGDSPDNSDFIGGDHYGNDLFGAKGTTVVAAQGGVVTHAGYASVSGNRVTVRDGCGWHYFHAHLDTIAPGIVVGANVNAGDVIGTLGNTGNASGTSPHVHFSIYPESYEAGIDPFNLLQAVDGTSCGGALNEQGCTATQADNCSKFGCGCVDGQCNGGYCPGTGCNTTNTNNCAAFGCACVDGQCNGGYCPGTGCTAKETDDCGKYGCGCVDHQCAGGIGCSDKGTGCTAKETDDCGKYGCGCANHQCSGGACDQPQGGAGGASGGGSNAGGAGSGGEGAGGAGVGGVGGVGSGATSAGGGFSTGGSISASGGSSSPKAKPTRTNSRGGVTDDESGCRVAAVGSQSSHRVWWLAAIGLIAARRLRSSRALKRRSTDR